MKLMMEGVLTEDAVSLALQDFVRSLEELGPVSVSGNSRSPEANYSLVKMLGLARTLFPTRMSEHEEQGQGDHFSSDPPVFGGLVPIDRITAPRLLEPLLRKSALYSRHTTFVTPHTVRLDGHLFEGSEAEVASLLAINHSLLPLLRAGRCTLLPAEFELQFRNSETQLSSDTKAPLVQDGARTAFTPLNVNLAGRLAPSAQVLLLREFVLPYYPDVDSGKLAELATKETDSFEVFMTWFTRRVRQVAAKPEAEDLSEVLEELDEGVARLRVEASNLQRSSSLLKGATLSGFSVSLGLVAGATMGLPSSALATVAGITGASTLTEVVRDVAARRKDAGVLRRDTFFVPYLNDWGR